MASSGSFTVPWTTGTRPASCMPRRLSVTNTRISLTPAGSPETVAVAGRAVVDQMHHAGSVIGKRARDDLRIVAGDRHGGGIGGRHAELFYIPESLRGLQRLAADPTGED